MNKIVNKYNETVESLNIKSEVQKKYKKNRKNKAQTVASDYNRRNSGALTDELHAGKYKISVKVSLRPQSIGKLIKRKII